MDRKILRKMFHDVAAFIVLGALGVSIKTCQGQKAEPALVQRLKILGTTLPLHLWSLRTTFRTLLPWAHKLHPTLLEVSLTKYLEVHATCWFTWLSSESQRRFLFHPGSKSMVSVIIWGGAQCGYLPLDPNDSPPSKDVKRHGHLQAGNSWLEDEMSFENGPFHGRC